jgi:hypothetical protein
VQADRDTLNRIGRAMYEAFHAADCSRPWDDLPDDRRWFWRQAAAAGAREIAAVLAEQRTESGRGARSMRTHRPNRIDMRAG